MKKRELCSGLFDDIDADMDSSDSALGPQMNSWTMSQFPNHEELLEKRYKENTQELTFLQEYIKQLEAQIISIKQDTDEALKILGLRQDQLNQNVAKTNTIVFDQLKEINETFNHQISKLEERRTYETKIQEMIENHNSIVQNFELQLSQFAKALSEKDMQIMKTVQLNEDLRKEFV